MSPTPDVSELQQQLSRLNAAMLAGEQRMQRMERRHRAVFSLLLGLATLGLYVGVAGPGGQAALAGDAGGLSAVEHDAVAAVARVRADFNGDIEAMRADLARTDDAAKDAGRMIAVLLHDIKGALEAVPAMASNMQSMSRDMAVMTANVHQMNHKMSVITGSIDTTMGRMGRMMPW